MSNSLRLAFLIVALPTAAAAQSQSQYYQPTPPPAPSVGIEARTGLELDIGLQAGELSCASQDGDQCGNFTEAGGLDLGATYMFTPTIGINGQVWAMGHSRDGWTLTQVITTVGVEWRPVPILSLLAGVGAAHVGLSWDDGDLTLTSDNAFAIMVGAGIDLVRARRWVVDVHAKYGQGFYGDEDDNGEADIVARNVGVGAGFTFLF